MGMFAQFGGFARWVSRETGRPAAFWLAGFVVVAWLISGPVFHYSDTWQLVINTATTVVTFLMVFLIQNTQNHDTAAIQVKLDEIIRSLSGAHNALLNLEELSESDLNRIRENYRKLAAVAREELKRGGEDTATPEVKIT